MKIKKLIFYFGVFIILFSLSMDSSFAEGSVCQQCQDINRDGKVNIIDLATVSKHIGEIGQSATGDLEIEYKLKGKTQLQTLSGEVSGIIE